MHFNNPKVAEEHARWIKLVEAERTGDTGLSIQDVLAVHFTIIDLFYGHKEGFGGSGPADIGLLSSAVSRQSVSINGEYVWPNVEDKAANLIYGIVLNHAFKDANKRTAFLSALYLLQREGYFLTITESQFEDFIVSVADKSFRNGSIYKNQFSDRPDSDIRFISDFVRKRIRKIDKKDYIITFRELDRILRRFDFCLSNQDGNYTDICRIENGFITTKVCQIGFPSWSKQVSRQAIKTVRRETGLNILNNVDSQSFFHDVEPVSQLLAKYHEPLVRLADR